MLFIMLKFCRISSGNHWVAKSQTWLSNFHFHLAINFLCLHAVCMSLNQVQLFATPWTVAHQRDSPPTPKLRLSQFSSVTQSCLTLCDRMDCSTPGLPVHHQFPKFTQSHVHWVGGAIQPSHPLSAPSPPTFNLSQHQSFQMSQFFALGGQSSGVSASTSVLPMNIQTVPSKSLYLSDFQIYDHYPLILNIQHSSTYALQMQHTSN